MAETLVHFCSLLIEDLYGTFVAQIFQKVAEHGRLSSAQIAQHCRLPIKHVKSGLSTLAQLQLLYHHTTVDGLSTYQANISRAYDCVRTGTILNLVQETLGSSAAAIIEELLDLGFSTVAELEVRFRARGRSKDCEKASSEDENFINVLKRLISKDFIHRLRPAHLQSIRDARQDVAMAMPSLGLPTVKGRKAQAEIDNQIDFELQRRLDHYVPYEKLMDQKTYQRQTSNNAATNPDWELILTVDFSNIATYYRNSSIVRYVDKLFGSVSAKVMEALLCQIRHHPMHSLDPSQLDIPDKLKTIDTNDLYLDLHRSQHQELFDELRMGNGRYSPKNPKLNGNSSTHQTNGVGGDSEMDEQQINKHLAMLAEGPFEFLSFNRISDQWTVSHKKLATFIRDQEIYRLMEEQLDPLAMRIVRMLIENGKLDEKALQEIGLMGAKELRQKLADLQKFGFVELQEVPREPQRQPNRTIFLWFFDAERVRKLLLNELYKTMARFLQRLRLEREKLTSTLTKIERTDVQGSEEEILSSGELQVLQRWRKKEAWLLGEINRLDISVAILRDL